MRELRTREDLLVCLRVDPMRRIVECIQVGEQASIDAHAVVQYPRIYRKDEYREPRAKIIAYIFEGSDAATFLDEVYDIEGFRARPPADEQIASQMPLRFGPYCSEWSLPEHLKEWSRLESDIDPIREIRTREELLVCLRENPAQRTVRDVRSTPTVIEFRDDGCEDDIAAVVDKSEAETYLCEVEKAHWEWLREKQSYPWALPLRLGPSYCEWCLPEHPDCNDDWLWSDEGDDE